MKLSALFYNSPSGPHGADGEFISGFAQRAEELGFDSLWVPEHIVSPVDYSTRYPFQEYADDDEFKPFPLHDVAFHDPMILLSWAAAVTSRIALKTGVLILPARNAILLAKQAASLDRLAGGGRLALGVGLGWMQEEVEAVGVPWPRRGRRTEEIIEAMRLLWRDEAVEYAGEFVTFKPVKVLPPRPEGIPIYIGGNSAVGARRAGRIGDGFIVHPPTPEGDPLIATMRAAAVEAGRDPDRIEVIGALLEPDVERLRVMEEAGYTEVYIASATGETLEAAAAGLDRIAEAVAPLRRDAPSPIA